MWPKQILFFRFRNLEENVGWNWRNTFHAGGVLDIESEVDSEALMDGKRVVLTL